MNKKKILKNLVSEYEKDELDEYKIVESKLKLVIGMIKNLNFYIVF